MFLRISSGLSAVALLAGCGGPESPPPPGDTVECAVGADASLAAVCTLERAEGEIILHHPDGGFRRLVREPATGALAPLDGAEVLVQEQGAEGAETFAIGPDRYRIPRNLLDPPTQ